MKCKSLNGYFSVEASLVLPVVLFLYLLIVIAGIYLYDRCVISQDSYLLVFRGSRFTGASKNYGEIIYGEEKGEGFSLSYLEDRLQFKMNCYPCYSLERKEVSVTGEEVSISTTGWRGLLTVRKRAENCNPVEIIRKVRGK